MIIELWHIVLLSLSVFSAFWALTKIIATQFERNLSVNHKQIADRLDRIEVVNREEAAQWQRVERELLTMKADLPLYYVRREDYVQAIASILVKLDSAQLRHENLLLKGLRHD